MKRKMISRILPVILIAAMLFSSNAYAANNAAARAASYQSKDVAIGSSNDVLMVGEIQPTIMSVTMPTYVPFNMARSIQGDNKVISPRITIKNNSSVPVALDVVYTAVDLSKLEGTTWSDGPNVGEKQIAVGFQAESMANQMPTSLDGTKWLRANSSDTINITSISALDSSIMYVVGTLGVAVPENAFTVTPTFVVRQAQ